MKPKFSENELEQLSGIACDQGWDSLEQSERIALGRWCTRTGRKRPGTVPNPGAAAAGSVNPVNGDRRCFEVSGMPRRDERTEEDLRLLKTVRLLEDFPDDIITGRPPSAYEDAAKALRTFRKPGVVADGLSRKRAMELRRSIRRGASVAWRPAGSYRAETAPDHDHDGCFRVIAQYLGGE